MILSSNVMHETKRIAGLGTLKVHIQSKEKKPKPQLVLLHGFGGGNAMWYLRSAEFLINFTFNDAILYWNEKA